MEYIYAAMLIHKAGQKVDEATVKKVLEAAGVTPDEARIKALVASLEGIDIEEAIKNASVAPAPAAAPAAPAEEKTESKEEKKDDEGDKKKEEANAAAGLGALFG
ncbi:MAG: 50S ribosomal protein P1 [Candidatus Woesearchaeota archaeon]